MRQYAVVLLSWFALATGCRTGRSYTDPAGPRYAGGPEKAAVRPRRDTLRLVTFNIEFARHIDSAIAVLSSEGAVRDADLVMLQEMDERGTRQMANAFGLWYVYYPAIFHSRTGRDFGNAVLSRWPIVDDAKIALPHVSRYAGTHRTATAVSIRVGQATVRVYSTHLGTLADIGSSDRVEQLRAVLNDAAHYERVVIGGDMNSRSVGRVAREAGYAWATERGPHTTRLGRWDHIFLKGMSEAATGTVLDVRHASDHRPVWATAVLQ